MPWTISETKEAWTMLKEGYRVERDPDAHPAYAYHLSGTTGESIGYFDTSVAAREFAEESVRLSRTPNGDYLAMVKRTIALLA